MNSTTLSILLNVPLIQISSSKDIQGTDTVMDLQADLEAAVEAGDEGALR